jgi:hypothetical protein
MRTSWLISCLAVALVLTLGGCGNNVRQALGFTKHAPDEFQVVAQPPLTLPPDYNLRAPEPGAPRPQGGTAEDQARAALTSNGEDPSLTSGSSLASTGGADQSPGEVALLAKAGANDIDPEVRAMIDAETAAQVERDQTLIERLVFWRSPEPYGAVVDPVKEAERLRQNQAEGKPITEGETPTILRRRKGLLEGIF